MKKHLYLVAFLWFPVCLFAQRGPTISESPLSDRIVSYDMDVKLNAEERSLSGKQRITWRNSGGVPVNELQFHLYLNAFKPGSTFMNESGGVHRGNIATDENPYGGIQINKMQRVDPALYPESATASAVDLTGSMRFIQPDDGNAADETVVSVALGSPVGPGQTITLDVDFAAQLPEIVARTGWEVKPNGQAFFMVAQWFPKLGVYEIPGQRYVPADAPEGIWNTHQFHANSEFYADYGTYQVSMTVPSDFLVGASGLLIDETTEGNTKTVTYRAEDVHDFAWTASEDLEVFTDTWEHVHLRLLIQPEHSYQAKRHFAAAKIALKYFSDWYGEYPYTTLTLVDAPVGSGANGMEYPTLITCGTAYMLPEWARALELVTIHEFGHQYWMGMLGSNEFEEAWLDEGINSYTEQRIMDAEYGIGSAVDFPGLPMNDSRVQRLGYTRSEPSRGALFTYTWKFEFADDYRKCAYPKPATVLATLERYLGEEKMMEVMRSYYTKWRFRHPTTRDFIENAEEVSGQDLTWFFDQFVYGEVAIDYALESINENRVTVKRLEDGTFPVTLRVWFEDGSRKDVLWDDDKRWRTFTFDEHVTRAALDPDDLIWLDINRLNNQLSVESDTTFASKIRNKAWIWAQQLVTLVTAVV